MDNEATVVVFRRWGDTGDILALFPQEPADLDGWYCLSFEHVGQHASANYFLCIQATRPATDEEAAPLAEELTRIGYHLQPVKRASQRIHEARRAAARAIRARRL